MQAHGKRKRAPESQDAGNINMPEGDVLKASPQPDHVQVQSRRAQLFVRSLPANATSESLTEYFSQSYPLKHATVVVDPATKQARGYGFVSFIDAEDAHRAKEEFDGSVFEGRKIRVEVAEPRSRDLVNGDGLDGSRRSAPSAKAVQAKAERDKEKLEARKSPKLIVRNLPWAIREPDQLALLFRSYGKVKHVTIPKKPSGEMSGFGFVVLRGKKNAEKALNGLNGIEVDGRTLAIDWAVEKEVWESTQKHGEEGDDKDQASEIEPTGQDLEDEDHGVGKEWVSVPEKSASDGYENSTDQTPDDFQSEVETVLSSAPKVRDMSSTLFIRNLPFTATDESLRERFTEFGAIRYARIVLDHATERPRGTGFVCFFNQDDADSCLRTAPRQQSLAHALPSKSNSVVQKSKLSVLENVLVDPSGKYTLHDRVLHVSRAVDRNEAARLEHEGSAIRNVRDKDKRRLYLLSEGTISSKSPLYNKLAPSEVAMREASAKQRQMLIQNNPTLHLSLTRLSIRNIPRTVTSKDLKALAREAVVGFAKDVKEGRRNQLSKEEEQRGGDEMRDAEKARKAKGKGIVKQAKIVFEGREGGKVAEGSGAGRSRGYGFVEYSSHRWALMGLRWLNGHLVDAKLGETSTGKSKDHPVERKKRLIVEFAIENAQVVARRKLREVKARERSKIVVEKRESGELPATGKKALGKDTIMAKTRKGNKRKHGDMQGTLAKGNPPTNPNSRNDTGGINEVHERLAKRQRIITKKRMMRRAKKQGAKL